MVSFPMIRAIMRRVAYKSSISQHFFLSVFECVSDLRDGGVEAGDLQVRI